MAEMRDYEFKIIVRAESRLEATQRFIELRDSLRGSGWTVTDQD